MTKYPNKEALRTAILDIYLDAMRDFIPRSLEKVRGTTSEELISIELECEPDDSKEAIDISNIPHLIKTYWSDIFNREFTSKGVGGDTKTVAWNSTRLIVEARNHVVHPNTGEIDSEYTRTCLFLIADVLDKINAPAEKEQVETIRDILFPDDTDERIADMTKQLEAAKAENTELEKQVKTISDRLKTMSFQLKMAVAGKTVAEERLSDISNRFEEAEVEKAELKKRLETTPDQLKAANAEKAKYEKALKAASNQLATLKRKNAQLEARLETTSTQLEDVEEELADSKDRLAQLEVVAGKEKAYEEDYAELEERLPLGDNAPDSITFHGTIFTRHLNEYHVAGDDISQGFWHYWQSQGREGKQRMRDAGWSVEKVDGDWEVMISPEDFQAWIVGEITELNDLLGFLTDGEPSTQPIRPSSEKIFLPAVKEMVKPALTVLADGKEHRRVEIIDYLAEHFSLTADEREYLSKTGQSEKHLMNKGLIERTRTGYYRITTLGLLSSGTRS